MTGVRARVDAGGDDVRPSPNAPRQARYTAVAGGRSIASTGTSGSSSQWCSATGIGCRSVQRADRCARAAEVRGRGDHEHVVAGVVERLGERHDAGGLHTVVVRHQDSHDSEPTSPSRSGFRTSYPLQPPLPPSLRCGSRWVTLGPMADVLVVGGGVLGTMHAYTAQGLGHTVTHLEADLEARKASVRNFGLIWVSGRAPGAELSLALQARRAVGGHRPTGPRRRLPPRRLAHGRPAPGRARGDGGRRGRAGSDLRQVRMLDAAEVPAVNPAVRGSVLGALHCARDVIVEPRRVLPACARGR